MSRDTNVRPDRLAEIVTGLAGRTDLRPHVRQATAEITELICAALPVAAVATAATGLATGAIILLRRHRR